jgi:hypothetical protein
MTVLEIQPPTEVAAPAAARIYLLGELELDLPDSDAVAARLKEVHDREWVFLAALALAKTGAVPKARLLDILFKELRIEQHLVDNPDDLEWAAARAETIDAAVKQLRVCASRVRKLLEALGATNPVRISRSAADRPVSGSYKLVLPEHVVIDAVQFRELMWNGGVAERVQALHLVRGKVLDGLGHAGRVALTSQVRSRVRACVDELCARHPAAIRDRATRHIVNDGDHRLLDRLRANDKIVLPGNPDEIPPEHDDGYDLPRLESGCLSQVARSTLCDLLCAWAGSKSITTPAPQVVRATLPAQWGDVDSIELDFFIFAQDSPLEARSDPRSGSTSRRRQLVGHEDDDMREYLSGSSVDGGRRRAYAVLALPKVLGVGEAQLIDIRPPDRFDLYVVDLDHDFGRRTGGWIDFPDQNKLNLALFSLIWSARWVEDFFSPLMATPVLQHAGLRSRVELVFSERPNLAKITDYGWRMLENDLPRARGHLDDELFRRFSFRFGMGCAMQLINGQMIEATERGRLTAVRTYCPEALYGTANLWLFSRIYRQFMDTTHRFQDASPQFRNQRLLPVADTLASSRLYAAALWHVLLSYRMLKAEVALVEKAPVAGSEDHGYYEGGIGQFQWISLSDDGGDWVRDQADRTVQADHLDFLCQAQRQALVGGEMSQSDFAALCLMDADQLQLGLRPPVWLFPSDNHYLRCPRELWGPTSLGARQLGRF